MLSGPSGSVSCSSTCVLMRRHDRGPPPPPCHRLVNASAGYALTSSAAPVASAEIDVAVDMHGQRLSRRSGGGDIDVPVPPAWVNGGQVGKRVERRVGPVSLASRG